MHASLTDAAPALSRPGGLRRPSPAARAALAAADRFAGLPDGVTRWRLAAALRAAARPLGLSASMLALIEHYVDLTWDADWAPGAEPVVIRPLVEVAEHFGKSERQIRNLERALAERGLLAWRDSGNHHRKGRRDRATGRLIWGYGPSLAPLGRRAAEILATADAARAELAEIRRLRLAISALRRRLRETAALAADPSAAEAAMTAMAAMPVRNPAGARIAALRAQRDRLIEILGTLVAADPAICPAPDTTADQAAEDVEEAPEGEISGRRITDTGSDKSMNGYRRPAESASAASAPRRRAEAPGGPPADRWSGRTSERKAGSTAGLSAERASGGATGLERLAFGLVEAAAGELLRRETASEGGGWSGLASAAERLTPLFGISPESWAAACGALGRNAAAVCLLLLERGLERDAGAGSGSAPRVERPAAYFAALVARGREGRLRLDRSVFALTARRQPCGRAGASTRPIET